MTNDRLSPPAGGCREPIGAWDIPKTAGAPFAEPWSHTAFVLPFGASSLPPSPKQPGLALQPFFLLPFTIVTSAKRALSQHDGLLGLGNESIVCRGLGRPLSATQISALRLFFCPSVPRLHLLLPCSFRSRFSAAVSFVRASASKVWYLVRRYRLLPGTTDVQRGNRVTSGRVVLRSPWTAVSSPRPSLTPDMDRPHAGVVPSTWVVRLSSALYDAHTRDWPRPWGTSFSGTPQGSAISVISLPLSCFFSRPACRSGFFPRCSESFLLQQHLNFHFKQLQFVHKGQLQFISSVLHTCCGIDIEE